MDGSIFSDYINDLARDYICSNPDTFVQFLECNKYTVVLISICVFLFFLGIAIIIKIFEKK